MAMSGPSLCDESLRLHDASDSFTSPLLCHTPRKIELPVDLGPSEMRNTNRSSHTGYTFPLSCQVCRMPQVSACRESEVRLKGRD